MSESLLKVKRETARWRILNILNAGRPTSMDDSLLLEALAAARTDMTLAELRRELDYLEDRELVSIEPSGSTRATAVSWDVKLSHHGVDIVEYTVDVEPGIARPPKRW